MSKFDFVTIVILGATGLGIALAWRYHQWQRRVRRVQGVVVDQVESVGPCIGPFYYPVVEFTDAGGERIRFTDRFGHTGHPLFPVGSCVSVDYRKSDPGQAQIHMVALSRTIAIAALVMGTGLLALGLWPR